MDEKFILSVIDKFSSAAIAELEFDNGTTRLALRKEGAGRSAPTGKEAEHSVRLGITAHPAGEADGGEKIVSPIVATFYSTPNPDAPPYVKPGSKVKAGQTLCILEAMKMMNHLEAEFDCEILKIHASGGDMVEYGQELFTVKRN